MADRPFKGIGVELTTDQIAKLRALGEHERRSVGFFIRDAVDLYIEARLKAPNVEPAVREILESVTAAAKEQP